jgi:carbonic anhydrase
MVFSTKFLKRYPSRLLKSFKSAAILSPNYFKSVQEMEKVLRLLDLIGNLEGPSVEFLAEHKWDYKHEGHDWAHICPFGPIQSPIRITTEETHRSSKCFEEKYYPLELQYSPIMTRGRFTKRIYVVHGDYGKMLVYPPVDKKKPRVFESVQFHFHAPCEHEVDGNLYDLEMHLVHKDIRKGTYNAVLGFMFKNTGKFNPFIQSTIDALEKPEKIDLAELLKEDPQFYFYHGSLTTPPCSENILWFLTSKVMEMDEKQLRFFTSRWAGNEGYAEGKGNNRELQPLYNRPIIYFDEVNKGKE